ncbi:sulfatase family protein [Pontiella sulfatireligans]|uniref:Arylsulfatase n=1 Tax=Pontiella sulfatireligans TaxID=2750658 RepID=A0A6C2UQA2_9BACT|nr:sulfatase-like hydrolase/transferase [Pontiella sulfatireligans]SPS74518.1 sulfatase S1_51 [Kiritimatiellales bacterium]VGO22472.1 Arylsulfatase [Pontiella sulfatireligans]
MKRQIILAVLASLCFAVKAAERKPNVIVLYTDDQKMDSFGFIRGKAHTPNIDRLAKTGAYFSNAYASSSVCSPSRYSCLTGQYASRCNTENFHESTSAEGMTKVLWNMGIGDDEWTFAKVMQQNGYKTGMVGKWHVGHGSKYGHRKQVPNSDPSDPATKAVLRYNQEIVCKGIADKGFDFVGGVYAGNPNDDKQLIKTGCNTHAVEWQTKHALDFIEQNKNEPFVLYYASTLLHVPFPHESLKGDPRLSPLGLLDEPITGILPSREDVIRRAKEAGVTNEKLWGATWLDDVVGALQQKLADLGLEDDTLILYFNDNGTDDSGKGSCYQGGAHVPMLAYLPGVVQPGERTELVSNIDIAPTIFEMCGIAPPATMHLDGKSIMPLARNEKTEWRDSLYLEIGLTRAVVSGDFKYLAFRVPESYTNRPLEERMEEHRINMEKIYKQHPWTKEKWTLDPEAKYLQMGMSPGGDAMERFQIMTWPPAPFVKNYFDPDQLYDLKRDPRETTNLASNPEYAAKLEKMQGKLKKLLADVPGTFADLKPE